MCGELCHTEYSLDQKMSVWLRCFYFIKQKLVSEKTEYFDVSEPFDASSFLSIIGTISSVLSAIIDTAPPLSLSLDVANG